MRGRILKLQYLSCVLLGSLQESVFHLAAESENYLALSIILFLFFKNSSFSPLSPHVVSFFLARLSPFLYLRYSSIRPQGAAGSAEKCKVHFCPLVRACVGPAWSGWTPAEGPGQFYCPSTFQSMKDMVGSEGRRGSGQGGQDGWGTAFEWGSGVCVCYCRLPPLFSSSSSSFCPVLSCPLRSRRAGTCTCLKSTPQGQTPISPSPRFYRNAACATHTGVHLHSFKWKAQRDM